MPFAPTTSSTARCRCSTATRSSRPCSRRWRAGATIVLRRRFSASGVPPRRAPVRRHVLQAPSAARSPTSSRRRRRPDDRDHSLEVRARTRDRPTADTAAFRERFGVPVIEGYGSSENAIIIQPGAAGAARRARACRRRRRRRGRRPRHGEECPRRALRRATAGCSTPTRRSARSSAATSATGSRATTTTPRPTPSAPATAGTGPATSSTATRTASSTSPVGTPTGSGSTARTSPPHRSSASCSATTGRRASPCTRCPTAGTGDQVMAAIETRRAAPASTRPGSPRSSPSSPTSAPSGRRATCASSTPSRSPAPTRSTRSRSDRSAGPPTTRSGTASPRSTTYVRFTDEDLAALRQEFEENGRQALFDA